MDTARMRRTAFGIAAAYLLLPGHPDAFFRGVPLGLAGLVIVAAGLYVWIALDVVSAFRRTGEGATPDASHDWPPLTIVLVCLCAIKLAAAIAAPPVGWMARYYANDRFAEPYRHSTEFPTLDATRIDRAIDFRDDGFPVYFLNEADFNREIRREVTMPVTARWSGYVHPDAATALPLTLTARGAATLSVDGQPAIEVHSSDAARTRTVMLTPGDHRLDVTYSKPAATDPLLVVNGLAGDRRDARLFVTPRPVGAARRLVFRATARIAQVADVCAAIAFGVVMWRLVRARRGAAGWHFTAVQALCAVMFALFVVQGVQAALPHVHRAVSLSGGDDWLAFEARAREVLTGGPLMRFGRALGAGEVFYYYPGYSYFLAAVHAVSGEDLSGPIFVNFMLLFLANVVSYRIAVRVFGAREALGAAVLLVVIEEAAFMRHYTSNLLSENLYFLTVPLTVLGLVMFLQDRRLAPLAWAGIAAGVSAVTRPAMMMYLPPAVAILAVLELRRREPLRHAAASIVIFTGCWFSIVLLATLRNYLMTGTPTLITESPAHSFILYNLPPTPDAANYLKMHTGGMFSSASVLLHIAVDHPRETFQALLTKAGFTFGMIQWMGGHLHPELVLVSLLYFAALLTSRAARAPETWPIHGFVAAHLAGMLLTMPSNYGYRLILPMYLFLPIFAAKSVTDAWTLVRGSTRPQMAPAAPARRTL